MKNSLKFLLLFLVAALLMLGSVAIQAQQPQSNDQPDNKPSSDPSAKSAAKPESSSPATTPKPTTPPKPAAQKKTPPADPTGTVWVNTDSGLYHKPGTRWYGKTKHGKYMTEADAQKPAIAPPARNKNQFPGAS